MNFILNMTDLQGRNHEETDAKMTLLKSMPLFEQVCQKTMNFVFKNDEFV